MAIKQHVCTFVVAAVVLTSTAFAQSQNATAPTADNGSKQSSAAAPAQLVPLKSIKRIYIESMADDLDKYISAEITKQLSGKVLVTMNKQDADAVLTGTGEWQNGTRAAVTGRYLGLHDTATGAVQLISKDGSTVLWASEAGDRSLWWGAMKRGGPRKVADRLIHNLKKAME